MSHYESLFVSTAKVLLIQLSNLVISRILEILHKVRQRLGDTLKSAMDVHSKIGIIRIIWHLQRVIDLREYASSTTTHHIQVISQILHYLIAILNIIDSMNNRIIRLKYVKVANSIRRQKMMMDLFIHVIENERVKIANSKLECWNIDHLYVR